MVEEVSYADDSVSSVITHIKNVLVFNVQFRIYPWNLSFLINPKRYWV
jgi:hypothetical protein